MTILGEWPEDRLSAGDTRRQPGVPGHRPEEHPLLGGVQQQQVHWQQQQQQHDYNQHQRARHVPDPVWSQSEALELAANIKSPRTSEERHQASGERDL